MADEHLEFSIRNSVLCMEYNKNIDTLWFSGAALLIFEYSRLTFFHKWICYSNHTTLPSVSSI